MNLRAMCLGGISFALVLSSAATAVASPWTLSQHELVLSSDISFATADSEYLDSGKQQVYSLQGTFKSTALTLGARYGFTDKFEMEVRPTFKQVGYEADSVILNIFEEDLSLQDARNAIIDFDSSRLGAADMDVAARYNLLRTSYLVITPEVGFKLPLGYDKPQGTFSNLDEGFDTADDVTLGDGQIDMRVGLLLGGYIPQTRTFIRADAAYNYRTQEPADQVLINGKVGQFLTQSLIVFGGVRWAESIGQGESLGDTYVDTMPTQSAEEFDFGLVSVDPLYLDRSFVVIEAGGIIDVGKAELGFTWSEVVDARNYGDLRTLSFTITTSIPDATRREEDSAPESDEVEEVVEEVIVVPADGDVGEGEIIEEVIIEEVPVEEVPEAREPAPPAEAPAPIEGGGEPEPS